MTSPTIQSFDFDHYKDIRVVFMGTPEFSSTILEHLLHIHINIVAVYTQMDKPVGRQQELQAPAVKVLTQGTASIPVEQPPQWDDAAIEQFKSYQPDLVIVAAYGKILPKKFLEIPRLGCINIHTSLLPRWRGASPVQNALLAGDTTTGVTLMLMDEKMDTGPIIDQITVPIESSDTTPTLLDKLAQASIPLLDQILPQWLDRTRTTKPQSAEGITLCQMIEREDGRIFWNEDIIALERKYRALAPWPGLFFYWQKDRKNPPLRIKLIEASFRPDTPSNKPPHPLGTAFLTPDEKALAIQCSGGVIIPTTLQVAGKKSVSSKEFISGYPEAIDTVL
ncbi:MAG: methionyl-tRNA formyltransferase [Candidatus Moraniibacteriota bacterium]